MNKVVQLDEIKIANNLPFILIAGPCVLESRDRAFFMCDKIKEITTKLKIPFIYKSSFDKANRSSVSGGRGIGIEQSLKIFQELKNTFNVPIITDVHESYQCKIVAEVVDILQIPAFLCRQTDLLLAAGETGKVINVKKGQFLAPWDMGNVAKKIASTDNENILLCERGTSFGYNNLVVDMMGLVEMAKTSYPVIFDATHSVQKPGGLGDKTGGNREMVPYLAKAALAIGVAGLFMEVHNDPDSSPSDAANILNLKDLEPLLNKLMQIDLITKN